MTNEEEKAKPNASGNVGLHGKIHLQVFDKNGKLKYEQKKDNLIVTVGKTEVAQCIGSGLTGVAFNCIAVGTSATGPAAGNTQLGAESTAGTGLARAAATVSQQTTTTSGDTARFTHTWTVSGAGAVLAEVGVLNNTTSGGDTVAMTYDIIVG
jgi:hypothetical protein